MFFKFQFITAAASIPGRCKTRIHSRHAKHPATAAASIPGRCKTRIHSRCAKCSGFHRCFDTGPPQNTHSLTGCETPRFPLPFRYRATTKYAFTYGMRNAPVSAAVSIPGHHKIRIHLRDAKRPGFRRRPDTGLPQLPYRYSLNALLKPIWSIGMPFWS